MLAAAKPILSAGAALALAGNKPASASSVLSVKQAPASVAGGVVLSVDGKRTVATRAAIVGRGDNLEPRGFSVEKIKTIAEETSSLLEGLRVPRQGSIPEQYSFSKEVDALKKLFDAIADGAGVDEDGAVYMLIGVHTRVRFLLTQNDQSLQDFLVSSMSDTKTSVEQYMAVQDTKSKISNGADGRMTFYDMVNKSSDVQPTPTVCSPDEVKMVLDKTLVLLEALEPDHSTSGMAGLFYKLRSNCRALLEEVEKKGVDEKTGSAITMIHISALFVLGQNKMHFSYQDAADDSLLSSLRRLEVALQDYKLGGEISD